MRNPGTSANELSPSRMTVALAFAAVYIIWGSTYLAIRVGVETIPPLLMAGVRFVIAGAALYAWAKWRGVPRPERVHWRSAMIVGGLLLLGGNGGVCWAEQHVPSGVAALLVTSVPLWLVLLNWLRRHGVRPSAAEVIGLILGFVGVVVLIDPRSIAGHEPVDRIGAGVLVLASFLWALGSLYSRHTPLPSSPLMSTAMQMICGGVLLLIASAATGDAWKHEWSGISLRSLLAMAYLIVFGALIGFTAYVYILKVSTPARVGTYAYVNPVIAVLLGWGFARESVTWTTALAMAIILSGVVLITMHRTKAATAAARMPAESDSAPDGPSSKESAMFMAPPSAVSQAPPMLQPDEAEDEEATCTAC